MLIPTCKAYRTSYWLCVMTLAGSQTNGYSRAAIPSVEADDRPAHLHDQADLPGHEAHGQAVDPGRHLAGNDQSAAAGGGPAPEVSCAITVLLAAIRFQGMAG